jgi:hypothetical protein
MSIVPKRRDVRILLLGAAVALGGWAGGTLRALPLVAMRQPGLEMALFLRVTYSPSSRVPEASEWLVFVANTVFWSGAMIIAFGIRRAFGRARQAEAWLLCAALISGPLVLLSEILPTYFGGFVGGLWWFTYPGWALGRHVVWLPTMPIVMDMRVILGELMYPSRLVHLVFALVVATGVWTLVLWAAILLWRWFAVRLRGDHVQAA